MSDQVQRWPKTVQEAVDRLVVELADDDTHTIAHLSEAEVVGLHISLGLAICNTFGLWQGNRALLDSCSTAGGGPVHPDDASMVIIQALWNRLHALR
jgi:hypothetical protein